MKKKLYLHIGQPKTGTSSIQYFLARNRQVLSELGYCYPTSLSEPYAQHVLGIALNTKKDYPSNKWFYDRSVKHIMNQLRNSEHDSLVLSTESFWDGKPKRIYNYFRDFDLRIIIYIRSADEFLASLYNGHVKGWFLDPEKSSFDDFFSRECAIIKERYRIIRDWVKLIGKDKVILRPFESQQFVGGDLLLDFLSCIGLSSSVEMFDFDIPRRNKRLPLSMLKPMLALNRLGLPSLELKWLKHRAIAWSRRHLEDDGSTLLSADQRRKVLAKVAARESLLAAELLGQEKLFLTQSDAGCPCFEDVPIEQSMQWGLSIIVNAYRKQPWRLFVPAVMLESWQRLKRYFFGGFRNE